MLGAFTASTSSINSQQDDPWDLDLSLDLLRDTQKQEVTLITTELYIASGIPALYFHVFLKDAWFHFRGSGLTSSTTCFQVRQYAHLSGLDMHSVGTSTHG